MMKAWADRHSHRPAARDLRGIALAFVTAFAMWAVLIVGLLRSAPRIFH